LTVGHPHDRYIVIEQVAKQLKCGKEDCEERLTEREESVDRYLANLNAAHQVVDGKRILHWINRDLFTTSHDYLFRLLTDRAKSHSLPDDIVIVVRDRILGSART
jgi:hypothetical protein